MSLAHLTSVSQSRHVARDSLKPALADPVHVAHSVGMATLYLTSRQVADKLGYHRATVHRWAASGALEPALTVVHSKKKSTYYFTVEAVEAWGRSHRRNASAVAAGTSSLA